MNTQVVILGSRYAGADAATALEEELGPDAQLTWVVEHDHHLILYGVHCCIRGPSVESSVTIPVNDIKDGSTEFVKGRATDVDVDERAVGLEDGGTVDYDCLLVAIGFSTVFFGTEGLEGFAHQLKGPDDVHETYQEIKETATGTFRDDPTRVVIGDADLSDIQTAAEAVEYRDTNHAPIDIKLVEGMGEIFPESDPELQGVLRRRIEDLDIDILTGDFISKIDEETVLIGDGEDGAPEKPDYDVLIWTDGITGQPEASDAELEQDEHSHRFLAEEDFRASNDRVFTVGDCALVEQGPDNVAPSTVQVAWDTADVTDGNITRAIAGKPLKRQAFADKGMVISIDHDTVAHGVKPPVFGELPVNVFGGPFARTPKKGIIVNWITDVTSPECALSVWNDL